MSASDRPPEPTWPAVERRKGERRQESGEGEGPPADRQHFTGHRSGRDRRDESAWIPVALEAGASGLAAPDDLIASATAARGFAHARYSDFKVGAALETVEGPTIGGCNIENATYGLTLCAERVALVKALSDGYTVFTRIAVVADTSALTPPCGPCRQLLWEYCGDIDIVLANLTGQSATYRLSALLPLPFDARLLR